MYTEYVALVETENETYRATATAPFALSDTGSTEAEALSRLDTQVAAKSQRGARIVYRRLTETAEHPLAWFAGLADYPRREEYERAIQAYRDAVEADPDYL